MRTQLAFRLASAGALGALGVLALACSSGTANNPFASVDDFCTAYAKAVCQVSSTCQFDATGCQTYQDGQCHSMAAQATASGTRQYTSGNVQACIDALNSAYGNNATSISAQKLSDIDDKCQHVFVGSAKEGDPCQSDYDCSESGVICASAPGMSASTCAKPTPKDLGAVCADPGDQCPSNAFCQPQSGTSKCVASATNGQACSATMPCDSSDHCAGGTCEALATQGQPCTATADCASGLVCDTYTSATAPQAICVSSLTFGRGSVDCLGVDGQSTNAHGGTADAGSDAGSGGGTDAGATDAPTGG